MNTQPWLLLKQFLAAVYATDIRVLFRMRVNVLHEVLALREGSVADLALEPLEGLVDVDEVALEAVEGRKAAIAVILEATELFLLWVLTL